MTGKAVFSTVAGRTAVRAGAMPCALALLLSGAASGPLPMTGTLMTGEAVLPSIAGCPAGRAGAAPCAAALPLSTPANGALLRVPETTAAVFPASRADAPAVLCAAWRIAAKAAFEAPALSLWLPLGSETMAARSESAKAAALAVLPASGRFGRAARRRAGGASCVGLAGLRGWLWASSVASGRNAPFGSPTSLFPPSLRVGLAGPFLAAGTAGEGPGIGVGVIRLSGSAFMFSGRRFSGHPACHSMQRLCQCRRRRLWCGHIIFHKGQLRSATSPPGRRPLGGRKIEKTEYSSGRTEESSGLSPDDSLILPLSRLMRTVGKGDRGPLR